MTKYTVLLEKKKNWLEKQLIEQIIEVESRVPGFMVVHIFLKLVNFMTKQNLQGKSSSQLFNAKNVAQANVPCFP